MPLRPTVGVACLEVCRTISHNRVYGQKLSTEVARFPRAFQGDWTKDSTGRTFRDELALEANGSVVTTRTPEANGRCSGNNNTAVQIDVEKWPSKAGT